MEERKNAPMKLKEVWRDWNEKEEFGPAMIPLRMDELIQKEQERDRAARYVGAPSPLHSADHLSLGVCDGRHPAFRILLVVAPVGRIGGRNDLVHLVQGDQSPMMKSNAVSHTYRRPAERAGNRPFVFSSDCEA